jgi:hypothetical protein
MQYKNSKIIIGSVVLDAPAEVTPSSLKIVLDEQSTLTFIKDIINSEIRTQENIDFFKGLVSEVLIEQGLI